MTPGRRPNRANFRRRVLARDNFRCRVCGHAPAAVHHIIDCRAIIHGGYVPENGITLCPPCRARAGTPGYTEAELFARIGSSRAAARTALNPWGFHDAGRLR